MTFSDLIGAPNELVVLAVVITLAWIAQAATGFGSVVVAVALGAFWLPIDRILPVVVPLNLVLTAQLTLQYRAKIDRRVLLYDILPFMGVGTVVGAVLAGGLAGLLPVRVYGGLVLATAAWELVRLLRDLPGVALPAVLRRSVLFAAGVVHGVYASGGPLLVLATARTGLDKGAFRATLSAVWFVLNVGLVSGWWALGKLTLVDGVRAAVCLPTVLLGIGIGSWLHDHVSERSFSIAVQLLLLVAALGLLGS